MATQPTSPNPVPSGPPETQPPTTEGSWWLALVIGGCAVGFLGLFRFQLPPPLTFALIAMGATGLGWAVSSMATWRKRRNLARETRASELEAENAELKTKLADLEERLENVETISSLEMRLAAREAVANGEMADPDPLDEVPPTPPAAGGERES